MMKFSMVSLYLLNSCSVKKRINKKYYNICLLINSAFKIEAPAAPLIVLCPTRHLILDLFSLTNANKTHYTLYH